MELQEAAGSGTHSFRDVDGGQHVQGEQEESGGTPDISPDLTTATSQGQVNLPAPQHGATQEPP